MYNRKHFKKSISRAVLCNYIYIYKRKICESARCFLTSSSSFLSRTDPEDDGQTGRSPVAFSRVVHILRENKRRKFSKIHRARVVSRARHTHAQTQKGKNERREEEEERRSRW